MRRVRFYSWIRRQVLKGAGTTSFSLRKFAALAQSENNPEFRAALMLYAHENGCVDRLMSYIYDDDLRERYEAVAKHLGAREIERLALRGTPMMLLPVEYRKLLDDFAQAYHAPELNAAEKSDLCEKSKKAMLASGTSPAEVADALGLNRSNTYAYLASGDTGRFTVETARAIARYLNVE